MQSYNLGKEYSAVVPESKEHMPIYASFDMSRNHIYEIIYHHHGKDENPISTAFYGHFSSGNNINISLYYFYNPRVFQYRVRYPVTNAFSPSYKWMDHSKWGLT